MIRIIGVFSTAFFAFFLASCGSETVKREPLTPAVSKKFDIKGHIEPKASLSQATSRVAPIPNLANVSPVNLDPNRQKRPDLYSVSAINVPVSDLLYQLSVDSKKQLDLSARVKGRVTVNLINQPLDKILTRLAEQVGAKYKIFPHLISVQEDIAYWASYKVDYVNLVKSTSDSSVLSMSVGGVSDAAGETEASKFVMTTETSHSFWDSLRNNLNAMVVNPDEISAAAVTTTQPVAATTDTAAAEGAAPAAPVTEAAAVSSSSRVVVNKEAGMVSVFATQKKQLEVKSYIDSILQRANKQVLIEATVIEVELSDEYQAGVDWSATTQSGGVTTTISQALLGTNVASTPNFTATVTQQVGSLNIDLGIRMLQQFGDAKVLSSPKIMTMNNQSSLLKVVDNQVYFTVTVNTEAATDSSAGRTTFETEVHSVPVGFMMNMTPFISDNEDISLSIRPTLSRIVSYVDDPNPELAKQNISSRIPVIQEREMESVLRLRNNQTAVIGGLIQDVHKVEKSGVPGLTAIPFVGDAFSFKKDTVKKTELIIFIRPVIVHNPDIEHGDLQSFKPFLKTRTN